VAVGCVRDIKEGGKEDSGFVGDGDSTPRMVADKRADNP
jgi:hypothetical protein